MRTKNWAEMNINDMVSHVIEAVPEELPPFEDYYRDKHPLEKQNESINGSLVQALILSASRYRIGVERYVSTVKEFLHEDVDPETVPLQECGIAFTAVITGIIPQDAKPFSSDKVSTKLYTDLLPSAQRGKIIVPQYQSFTLLAPTPKDIYDRKLFRLTRGIVSFDEKEDPVVRNLMPSPFEPDRKGRSLEHHKKSVTEWKRRIAETIESYEDLGKSENGDVRQLLLLLQRCAMAHGLYSRQSLKSPYKLETPRQGLAFVGRLSIKDGKYVNVDRYCWNKEEQMWEMVVGTWSSCTFCNEQSIKLAQSISIENSIDIQQSVNQEISNDIPF